MKKDPVMSDDTPEAPVPNEAPEVPAPASDVADGAGAEGTPVEPQAEPQAEPPVAAAPVVEHRSFGRPPGEPMPVTVHTGG